MIEPAAVVGQLGQRDALGVQPRLVDTVVLGVVLPDIGSVRDLRQDLAPERLGRVVEDRLEARLDLLASVAIEQLCHPPRAHQASRALGIEVGGQRLGHPRVAGHDLERLLTGNALVPELDRRHHQAFFEDRRRVRGHRPRYGAADVVVMTEGLHERDYLRAIAVTVVVEDRCGDAQIGQVTDAAFGLVDVVVEEDVAGTHLVDRIVAHHGCTSAEYERPVSLRSCRSWMPARKSWASRIIGEREVRPIAVSTSSSTEAR